MAISLTILQSLVYNIPSAWTTGIQDGQCVADWWPSISSKYIYTMIGLIFQYALPLIIFVYCYSRIAIELRKRAQVNPINVIDQSTSRHAHKDSTTNRSQVNVIKTMVYISSSYAVLGFVSTCGDIASCFDVDGVMNSETWYLVSVILIFINVVLDALVYAICHGDVRKRLCGLIVISKTHFTTVTVRSTNALTSEQF